MTATAKVHRSRAQHILSSAHLFLGAVVSDQSVGIEQIETFANNADEAAHEHSREMMAYIGGDESRIASHANYVRTLTAKIVLLRDGYVPAMKIDRDNKVLRLRALQEMAYIRGDFEAMQMRLE